VSRDLVGDGVVGHPDERPARRQGPEDKAAVTPATSAVLPSKRRRARKYTRAALATPRRDWSRKMGPTRSPKIEIIPASRYG